MPRLHVFTRLAAIAASFGVVSAFAAPRVPAPQIAAPPRADSAPPRPRLADTIDARDWRSYFGCAMDAKEPSREKACLYWAERLEPEAAETPYLRFVLSEAKDTSALLRALALDPFMYQTRIVVINAKPGLLTPPARRAWMALEGADYFAATRLFLRYLASKPADVEARWGAALAYHYRGRDDSAAVQLAAMILTLRAQQAERTASHLSLDFAELARATALRLARDTAGARAALEQSLTENFGSFRARAMLADISLGAGDTALAAEHWASALELADGDRVVRARHARFLAHLRRYADAERELNALIALEPDWVNLRRDLAVTLDSAGAERRLDAVRAYLTYLDRAPREPAGPRELVVRRLAELRGEPAARAPARVPD